MKTYKLFAGAALVVAASVLLLCNGGSTEIGNARSDVTGSIADNGKAADSAVVELVAEEYEPGASHDGNVFTTVTDSRGVYRFERVPHGVYYLNAKRTGKRLLRGPISIDKSQDLATDELKSASQLSITIPKGWIADEVFVTGMAQSWPVVSGAALLDSLPPGEVTIIASVSSDPAYTSTIKQGTMALTVGVTSGEVAAAAFDNAPPRIVSTQTDLVQLAGSTDTCVFKVIATDPEGLAVRYNIVGKPTGVVVDSVTGTVVWVITGVSAGDYTATVKIADAGGAYRTVQVTLRVTDAAFTIGFYAMVDTTVIDKKGSIGKQYQFTAAMPQPGTVSAYRFAWGDGDTTLWQAATSAAHAWKSAGRYAVRFQGIYSAESSFTAWSGPLWVRIDDSYDMVSPVITLIGSNTMWVPESLSLADFMKTYKDPGYTAVDNVDGDLTGKVTVGPITRLDDTIWYCTYDVVDAVGNAAITVKRIFVVLNPGVFTPPIIDLTYQDSVIRIVLGNKWREPGYSASDVVDGDITSKVTVDSSEVVGNINRPGIYMVFYSVTNSSGFMRTEVRTVAIIDPSAPDTLDILRADSLRITLKGGNSDTVWLWEDTGATGYTDPGATAYDPVFGDLTSQIVTTGRVDINKPGTYTLTYFVRNPDSMANEVNRTVEVIIPPDDTPGMRSKYGVPMDALFPPVNMMYVLEKVDGDTSVNFGDYQSLNMMWDSAGKSLGFFQLNQLVGSDTFNLDIRTSKHSFDTRQPAVYIRNSMIPGINGPYLVNVTETAMYWVAFNGRIVLVWREL